MHISGRTGAHTQIAACGDWESRITLQKAIMENMFRELSGVSPYEAYGTISH